MKILLETLVLLLIQGAASPQLGTGSASGILLSADGTPAPEFRVAAMQADPAAANPGYFFAVAKTDRDGRYRLDDIPPGRYFIVAGPFESLTFFPSGARQAGATPIQIRAGQFVEKVDFSIFFPRTEFNVSGKLSAQAPSGVTSVVLDSTKKERRQTPVKPDGTFEFLNVPRGAYYLQSFSGDQRLPVVVNDRDITALEWGSVSEVRVSGNVVMNGISPGSIPNDVLVLLAEKLPRVDQTSLPANSATQVKQDPALEIPLRGRSVHIGSDGGFEFLKVTPGNYDLLVESGLGPTLIRPMLVADKDITGLQMDLPYQLDVPGRVVVEGGDQSQIASLSRLSFQATDSQGTNAIGTTNGGSFRLRLREGESQITVLNPPFGHTVKSMVSGTIDLLQNPIIIAPGQKFEDIVLTLSAVPAGTIKGVRVSGQIIGMSKGSPGPASLMLLQAGTVPYTQPMTAVNPDGSFTFPVVPPGTYSATSDMMFFSTITVGEDAITGFQIPYRTDVVLPPPTPRNRN